MRRNAFFPCLAAMALALSGCGMLGGKDRNSDFDKPDMAKYKNALEMAQGGLHGTEVSKPKVPVPGEGATAGPTVDEEIKRLKERIRFLEVQMAMGGQPRASGGIEAPQKTSGAPPRLIPQTPQRPSLSAADIPTQSLLHGVHLASYKDAANAAKGWRELQAAYAALFGGLNARLESVNIPGKGRFLRLKAGPFESANAATAACGRLEARGDYCQATDFEGDAL